SIMLVCADETDAEDGCRLVAVSGLKSHRQFFLILNKVRRDHVVDVVKMSRRAAGWGTRDCACADARAIDEDLKRSFSTLLRLIDHHYRRGFPCLNREVE